MMATLGSSATLAWDHFKVARQPERIQQDLRLGARPHFLLVFEGSHQCSPSRLAISCDYLLRVRRSPSFRDDAGTILGELAISPLISAAFCILILRWRHIASPNWAVAMLLLAIPGMIGEAVVLSNLGTFMPRIREASGGRYGAFLFATYAVVVGIAEFATLRSAR